MAARYRVTQVTFISPHLIQPGSIIETTMEPGDHFEPLNEEAEAAMEQWYSKEYPEKDKDGALTGKTFKPNEAKRPVSYEDTPRAQVVLIADPPKEATDGLMGLAEALASRAEPDLKPSTDKPLVAVGEGGTDDGGTTIVSAAPAPKKE